jgi:hypothetical protein
VPNRMTTSGREGDDGEESHDADCQDAGLHSTTHAESLCRARQKVVPGGISTVRGTWARACGDMSGCSPRSRRSLR